MKANKNKTTKANKIKRELILDKKRQSTQLDNKTMRQTRQQKPTRHQDNK